MIFLPEKMTAGVVQDQESLQKQMGCMAAFLQIFDRHHHLTGKRLCSAETLPSSSLVMTRSLPPPGKNVVGSKIVTPRPEMSMPSETRSPAPGSLTPSEHTPTSPLRLPVFDFKEGTTSPWKFSKEAPRLSLDSRAIVDARGNLKPLEVRTYSGYLADNDGVDDSEKQRRSPSVIARLMGLEPLPDSGPEIEPVAKSVLWRSASESRVSKDLFPHRSIDDVNFQLKQNIKTNSRSNISSNFITDEGERTDKNANSRSSNFRESNPRSAKTEQSRAKDRGTGSRKSFFDSADFFPEPKQTVMYEEIEKRLKPRGIDEPPKDLETLKQIVDALQLKGLLHSKKYSNQTNSRSFVYEESPTVITKTTTYPGTARRLGDDSPPPANKSRYRSRRNVNHAGETLPAVSPRREASSRIKPLISATTPIRRKPSSNGESPRSGRASPVQSPKLSSRATVIDPTANRSPRIKKETAEINQKIQKAFVSVEEDLSCAPRGSLTTNSQTDPEAKRMHEGRNLLERCDKLLQRLEEITTPELQPSPVSVLDQSFYKEDESPSPIMKRQVGFEEESVESDQDDDGLDTDFIYVSDALRASRLCFDLLEKQQYLRGKDTSQGSRLERRLIFDTVCEILHQRQGLPPWKISWRCEQASVWSEFQKIRERNTSGDLFQLIGSVLRKDLAGDAINSWEGCPVEMSEAVLFIERLIFKDLIGETIQNLAALSGKHRGANMPRRRLVF